MNSQQNLLSAYLSDQRSEKEILALINENKHLCSQKYRNEYPIHFAARYFPSNSKIIHSILTCFPESAKKYCWYGFLPIHVVIGEGTTLDVVKMLVDAYPESVAVKDRNGETPIHVASSRNTSIDIIIYLLSLNKQICREGNWLPIHSAVSGRASIDTVKLVLQAYPDAVRLTTFNNTLPMHWVCRNNCSFEIFHLFFKEYPESVMKSNSDGRLPIHLASCYSSIKVILALLQSYPNGCAIRDNFGKYPVHYFLTGKAYNLFATDSKIQECLRKMIRTNPDAIFGSYPRFEIYQSNMELMNRSLIVNFMDDVVMSAPHPLRRDIFNITYNRLKESQIMEYRELNWLARKYFLRVVHGCNKTRSRDKCGTQTKQSPIVRLIRRLRDLEEPSGYLVEGSLMKSVIFYL